jgi:hypothetical protein
MRINPRKKSRTYRSSKSVDGRVATVTTRLENTVPTKTKKNP